ncbi:MAG: Uma2 family endonuclease [Cyanobacteria bacterium J06558_2]
MIFTLDLRAFTDSIDDLTLEQLSRENPELRFETNQDGKLIVMPPTGSQSGKYNGDLLIQVGIWNRQHKLGVVFDSSTGFRLSNGALRSPDVSWIAIERWNSLSPKQKRGFAPIDPDFVIELLSPTDQLTETQQKMREYIDCKVRIYGGKTSLLFWT